MKTPVLCLLAIGSLAAPLAATPDHAVTVSERLFGASATDYAILRTEDDNQCSYYSSRVCTWFDEYSKESRGLGKTRSTLLLDVTYQRDANHSDRNTPAPVTETVNSRDATLSMAELLQRYPGQAATNWNQEQLARIEVHPEAGIHFRKRMLLFDGGVIAREVFGDRHRGETWTLEGVSQDMNVLYLRLAMGQDQGRESRIVCVPPQPTKQALDQSTMQPIYLVAGKFDSLAEAEARGQALLQKARGLKIYNFHPEIWSVRQPTDRTEYLVAETYSKELLESSCIPVIEKALEIDFTPVSSERFIERTFVER